MGGARLEDRGQQAREEAVKRERTKTEAELGPDLPFLPLTSLQSPIFQSRRPLETEGP